MNRRRMLLLCKPKPLWVFKFGESEICAGEYKRKDNVSFTEGYLQLGAKNESGGSVIIGGINFSKYKTLFIECYTNVANWTANKDRYLVGYGDESAPWNKEGYTAFDYAPYTYKVLAFDISAAKGVNYIKAYNGTIGPYLRIKNIWLEG